MLPLSLDIETECAVSDCQDSACRHALDHHRNRITCVGLVWDGGEEVHRDLDQVRRRIESLGDVCLVGHSIIAFDLKTLKAKGLDLTHLPVECTQLMAVAAVTKVSDEYLAWYEERRKELNRQGGHHREAKKHSLKTLAPYFLNVEPFWETKDKNDDNYVLTDARHTLNLYYMLQSLLKQEGTETFYREKLLPWAWMLFRGEWEGVCLDLPKMEDKAREAERRAAAAKSKLDELWLPAYEAYRNQQAQALLEEYGAKMEAAFQRLKAPTPEKLQRTQERYTQLRYKAEAKLEPFNLDSPAQLTWLLRDHLGYDIENFEGEESTGVEVLERLAAEGKEDIKALLEYREANKLVTAFFPSYRQFQHHGRIHCSFSLSTARTGRTASSSPNLQQQPGHIRDIFVAPPGHSFIIRDYTGIEPVLVAYYSQDPILCDLLINKGGNFHSFNTPAFFPYVDCSMEDVKKHFPNERDAAKELGLMLIYGGGWRRIKICMMKRGFKRTDRECKERYEAFKELYRGVFDFKLEVLDPKLAAGEAMTNLLGRKFRIAKDDVHMKGLNTLVQSSASDLLLQSSRKVDREFTEQALEARPILWVHDEVIIRTLDRHKSQAERLVDQIMTGYRLETPYGLIPLKTEGHTAKFWKK